MLVISVVVKSSLFEDDVVSTMTVDNEGDCVIASVVLTSVTVVLNTVVDDLRISVDTEASRVL